MKWIHRTRDDYPNSATKFPPIAVIDVETTGLSKIDRIVEIAVISLDEHLQVENEWTTLVNPMRDVPSRATRIHGLTASDVEIAPTLSDLAGALCLQLSGRVVTGHNVAFDLRMIRNDLARSDVELPEIASFCTLQAAAQVLQGSRTLSGCCAQLGIAATADHSALGDARATTQLVAALTKNYAALSHELAMASAPSWSLPEGMGSSVMTVARKNVLPRRSPGFIRALVDRVSGSAFASPAVTAYMGAIDQALDDLQVTVAERTALIEMASELGLSAQQELEVRESYARQLVQLALRDGRISEEEQTLLNSVGSALGVEQLVLEFLRQPALVPEVHTLVLPRKICFTGDASIVVDGVEWSREVARRISASHGITALDSVTKSCEMLVAGDTASMSAKAQKARAAGIPVVSVSEFLNMLKVEFIEFEEV